MSAIDIFRYAVKDNSVMEVPVAGANITSSLRQPDDQVELQFLRTSLRMMIRILSCDLLHLNGENYRYHVQVLQ